jgi:hypothetical protein
MQCPSCGFENIPGAEQCAACSTALACKGGAQSVLPPRARDRTIRQSIRYRTHADELAPRLKSVFFACSERLVIHPACEPAWWHVVLCVIPGVGHTIALGKAAIGAAQLLIACVAVFVAVSLPSTVEGGVAASVVVMLSVFSVFVYVDNFWGPKGKGVGAWALRVVLLLAILACYQMLNYYLGYGSSLFRFFMLVGR